MQNTSDPLRVLLALLCLAAQPTGWLSPPTHIASGVDFFTTTDQTLVAPAGPAAVYLLRLDPARVRLESVHAHDEIMGLETVASLAARHGAIAAINGGFFNTANGDPVAVLKEAGELVSDAASVKGAVLIRAPPHGRTELDFDQIAAQMVVSFDVSGAHFEVPIDGLNTTRARGKLMLYTARYHADTDTAPTGTEWTIDGRPPVVSTIRRAAGHTPIPRDGFVLSFGGLDLPPMLASLTTGVRLTFRTRWRTLNGLSSGRLDGADAIVNGAGLLRLNGRVLSNWDQSENLSVQNMIAARHPRTLIGVDRRGAIWLAVVDGRQPAHSVGMQFSDLERLCDRLGLVDALNLDGGGSSTMVIGGRVVNVPSDIAGPRPVGDAILVTLR